ncbi:MAG: FAD-binding oxidoreductase [Acidimicrobiaceae bacterium]|nr:FAD-binding oxidoreductase [Acidimicrobiaceae bacterium]
MAAPVHTCDVAVVGRGLLGSAAARHLADLGADVVVIGPGEPAELASHNGVFGSHYDESRITRVLDRDPYFARIAAASLGRHRDLEERTGIEFYCPVGHLSVSGMGDYLDEMLVNATAAGVDCDVLDDVALAQRFPRFRFGHGMTGAFDARVGGHINPRQFIAAQCEAVRLQGGQQIDAVVTSVESESGRILVGLSDATVVKADQVLLATGAFANHLMIIPKEIDFAVQEHTVVFAEVDDGVAAELADMPSVICKRGDEIGESVYLLPPVRYPDGRNYLKIGQSVGCLMTDPATMLTRWFQSGGDAAIASWLQEELAMLLPDIEVRSSHSVPCAVTKSPTGRQFIDRFPDSEIYALLADDGHVAKSADELGRIAAHRMLYGTVPTEYADENYRLVYR